MLALKEQIIFSQSKECPSLPIGVIIGCERYTAIETIIEVAARSTNTANTYTDMVAVGTGYIVTQHRYLNLGLLY